MVTLNKISIGGMQFEEKTANYWMNNDKIEYNM